MVVNELFVEHLIQKKSEIIKVMSTLLDTKYVYIKSTTVYVPSSELELGLSQPLSRQQVLPSPQNRGGGHNRLRVRGWGSPNSDDWRKSLALYLYSVLLDNGCVHRVPHYLLNKSINSILP